ncbi:MAG: T9SS type A sorting domain-containing protein [Saprospiraceae bacterium]
MKTLLLIFVFLANACWYLNAQGVYDARQSVILQASVQENPPIISLNWVMDTANGGYTIWRKGASDNSWGAPVTFLDPSSVSWADSQVVSGVGYEYQVIKSLPDFPFGNKLNMGTGYIYTGIKLPVVHHRGACLMVIDSSFKQTLALEISRYLADLEADGWSTDTRYVDRNDSVPLVKSQISDWASMNPDTSQALFLFGRIPVPFSGNIAPDGHQDHKGAWPCDGYYGNLDGIWTDSIVNVGFGSFRNRNFPGDGRFDNNKFPTPVSLQVGRVDFSNMDKFPESEEELLRRYLNKNHAWRTGKMPAMERGLVDNNFPSFIAGIGQVGWCNFSAMFGYANVKDVQYRQTLSNESYMWSYGAGGGGPESASDISSTSNFTTDSLQTIFTMIFGSYFGDWDYPNDFLRAAIASRSCLVSTWANRPNWWVHHMAMGESIGYSTRVTMNNTGLYQFAYNGGWVHTALMGDPTLRMHILAPVENLSAQQDNQHIRLEWDDPANALGYFVYKKETGDSVFQQLNQVLLTSTFYVDSCAGAGLKTYMVRSMELRTSASGTYYNLSTGVTSSIIADPPAWELHETITMSNSIPGNGAISLDPEGGCVPYSYSWDNGENTSAIQNLDPGTYCVTIQDCAGCMEAYCGIVELVSAVHEINSINQYVLYPNPVEHQLKLDLDFTEYQELRVQLIDHNGTVLASKNREGKHLNITWDVAFLPAGSYRIQLNGSFGQALVSFIKL